MHTILYLMHIIIGDKGKEKKGGGAKGAKGGKGKKGKKKGSKDDSLPKILPVSLRQQYMRVIELPLQWIVFDRIPLPIA